jgi:hypothetical protein
VIQRDIITSIKFSVAICLKDSYVYITQQDAPHKDKDTNVTSCGNRLQGNVRIPQRTTGRLTARDVACGLHHLVPVAGLTTRQVVLAAIDVIVDRPLVFHSHVAPHGLILQGQGHWLPVILVQDDKLPPVVVPQQ